MNPTINKDVLIYIWSILLIVSLIYILFLSKKSPKKKSSIKSEKKQELEEWTWAVTRMIKEKNVKSWNLTTLTPLQARSISITCFLYIILWIILIYIWLVSNYLFSDVLKYNQPLKIIFQERIVFFVLGFSTLGWVANVFQNVILGNKSANFYNNILSKEHLFTDKIQHKFILRKLLNSSYNKTWNFWVEVQPFLSMLVWIVVYFIMLSGINWSWSIATNPNVFFYSAVAFLSWFFYDKFLDFLQKISSQILNNESYNDKLMSIMDEFDIVRQGIITESKTEEDKLEKEVVKK